MIRVSVLVPVLGRPDRAAPLVESLAASVTGPIFGASVMFLVSPGDVAQESACLATGARTVVVSWEPGAGDYAKKINHGFALAAEGPCWVGDPPSSDFCLLGADDLVFHSGWLEAAMVAQLRTGACVVGTNDLGNAKVMRGDHATHSLVHRAYFQEGVIDEPGSSGLLHEGYDHNFVDNEFVGTARARGTFVHAPDSVVEHLHPIWGKGENDDTYRKGQRAYDDDRRLHEGRRKLWETSG